MENPPAGQSTSGQIERYRAYLLLLARLQVDPRWRGKIDPSDIVQQTLVDVRERWHQLGTDNAELGAWLRKALANNLADAIRKLKTTKRDIALERPLDQLLDESSAALARWLAADQTSVSARAIRDEDLLRMAHALQSLSEPQREAIVWHYLQGCSLKETAHHLDRSDAATAGLLHRGLKTLRELMRADKPS
ncbi:MAG: sigma-70 family RNA polymerase sigma factor [Planctomycetota bacterium]|nr:sigma-70 family RNA polymerase sigma factor [Planctomycetota bacterium]